MNIQFKKGVLELCVLSLLSKNDFYGYELVKKISNNISISEGTIYPLLRRLTKENYFETYLKESSEGPPRKYYTLTKKGYEAKEQLSMEWYDFVSRVNSIIEEDDISEQK
ncbi:MAG: PadR family transcriptional regulator [Vallitalea sp.]|jgi:PadR family transcriptional regulator PadR|nr:PadR family transcriptional regulator [Vallitalea sp.]